MYTHTLANAGLIQLTDEEVESITIDAGIVGIIGTTTWVGSGGICTRPYFIPDRPPPAIAFGQA